MIRVRAQCPTCLCLSEAKGMIKIMNILLLEDEGEKSRYVFCFLKELGYKCTKVDNIESMKESVSQHKYDVVIIDLFVPIEYEIEFQDNGYQAISYLRTTTDTIFYPKKILVLSRFFDSTTCLRLNDMGTTGIRYDPVEQTWKSKLKDELDYIALLSVKKVDIAILTAVEHEKEQVRKIFEWEQMDLSSETLQFYSCQVMGKSKKTLTLIHCHIARMGMTASSYATTRIQALFEPDCIMMVGIAGGRKNKVNFGDIIIAEKAVDYGSGSVEEGEDGEIVFIPNTDVMNMNPKWTKCFNDYKDNKNLLRSIKDKSDLMNEYDQEIKLHIGKIATGPDVIKSEKFADEFIQKHSRDYLAIDMETYGVYYVANNYECMFMSIKGISDNADKDKNDTYQKYAALLAANLAKHYILNDYTKVH